MLVYYNMTMSGLLYRLLFLKEKLTVADTRLLSVKVRWCGSHLLRNFDVRILLRKVRGCLITHT